MFIHNLVIRFARWTYKFRGESKFKEWMELEGIKEKVCKAVEVGTDDFPELILEFISAALHVPVRYFENAEWIYVVQAFYEILLKLPIVKLPITEPSYETPVTDDWDYEGRTWHLYSHLIASSYGWTFEEISQLRVVDALATIQEIMSEKQLDREFQYSLSEIAYPYDAQTKKSKFAPLPRPHWMRPKIQPIQKFNIPKMLMPVGSVNYDSLPDEFKPKEIIH